MSVYNGKHLVCIYRWSKISFFSELSFKDTIYNAFWQIPMQTISVQCIWISISLLLVPQEGNIHCKFFIYIYFLHACSCALVTYIRNQYVCNLASRFQLVLPFQRKVNKRWLKFCPVHALNLSRDCCNPKGRARKNVTFSLILKDQRFTIHWLPS